MSRLVEAARAYIGTGFGHRGRTATKLDCAGLMVRVYADCGLAVPDVKRYGREPVKDGLVQAAVDALGQPIATGPVPAGFLRPGDVLLVKFDVHPHHVMLVGDYVFGGLSVIHADGHYSKVLETRLGDRQMKKITHVFRRPV